MRERRRLKYLVQLLRKMRCNGKQREEESEGEGRKERERKKRELKQGILTEGEGSVRLASSY